MLFLIFWCYAHARFLDSSDQRERRKGKKEKEKHGSIPLEQEKKEKNRTVPNPILWKEKTIMCTCYEAQNITKAD